MSGAKFEIVTTDAGHHGRIKGGQGEPVWVTEVHPDKRDAEAAFQFLVEHVAGRKTITASLVDERTVEG